MLVLNKFYTYIHRRPDREGDDSIFYVGKGTGKRAHNLRRKRNTHHDRIVKKCGAENITVEVTYHVSEEEAFNYEVALIAELRNKGVSLTNMTIGGEGTCGFVHSPETKKKMSDSGKGKIISIEQRIKASIAHKGKTLSEEHRLKIAATNKGQGKGKTFSAEHCLNISAAQKGKTLSEETKAKMSASNKGKNLGKTHSNEAKAKMSASAKARCAKQRNIRELSLELIR